MRPRRRERRTSSSSALSPRLNLSGLPGAPRHRPRGHGHRGRDGAPRRPLGARAGVLARNAARRRAPTSLLEASSAPGWLLAVELERLLGRRVPLFGVSLVLNLPRVFGGYPYQAERSSGSRARGCAAASALLPGALRRRMIERVPRELTRRGGLRRQPFDRPHRGAAARRSSSRASTLSEPLDAIVIGIPPTTPFVPREPPNPVSAAYFGLGLALTALAQRLPGRSGRDGDPAARPPAPLPLTHPDSPTGRSSPIRDRTRPRRAARSERAAVEDPRALEAYRRGRSVHPLEPFLTWSACDAASAGSARCCRRLPGRSVARASSASYPVHSVGAALDDGPRAGRRADRLPALAAVLSARRRE